MSPRTKAILESKQAERRRLAALPVDEKIALLERLRDRALAIAGSDLYRAAHPGGGRAAVVRGGNGHLNE